MIIIHEKSSKAKRKKLRKLKPVSRIAEKRKTLIKDRVINMRCIWHDGANANRGLIGQLNMALGLNLQEKVKHQINNTLNKANKVSDYCESIRTLIHSNKPYFWKRAGVVLRAAEAIRRDEIILRQLRKLIKLPEMQSNPEALKRIKHAETSILSHIHKYRGFFKRSLSFNWRASNIDINKFIKEFLEARGEIVDKDGNKVKVTFRAGSIPVTRMDPHQLLNILENLLTDTLAHQKHPEVEISTRMRRGYVIIDFLNVNGEPIPGHILAKIGREPYSITGRTSKGVGKISVNKIAQQYGGKLTVKNTGIGPLLSVSLKPA